MDRDEALRLLRSGYEGIKEWNRRRDAGEEIPFLTSADLSDADLSDADLTRVKLSNANLSGVNLSDASLLQADLREAILNGANCSSAILAGVDLRGAQLRRSNLTNVQFAGSSGRSPAILAGADLTEATFTDESNSTLAGSFLDLASCIGLSQAMFSDSHFLASYVARAFEYAHGDTLEASAFPEFVSAVVGRIRDLRQLLGGEAPPQGVVQVVHEITAELIAHLKAHPEALYAIKPRQFEELIAEILSHYGWEVRLTPAQKDGGYDLYAITKDVSGLQSAWIIECKKYAADRKIGVDIVRSLFGVKLDLKVANALLATTSHFTKGAKDYKASRYDLELRDYEGILEWINEYKPNPNGRLYVRDHKLVLPGE